LSVFEELSRWEHFPQQPPPVAPGMAMGSDPRRSRRSSLGRCPPSRLQQNRSLALTTLPSTHWAIEAMLGATFTPSQNRQPIGPALLRAVAEDNTTDSSYTD
jgi:hypothetical protein